VAGLAVVATIALWAVASCAERSPVSRADPPPDGSATPSVVAPFDGAVQCQPGEEDGAAFWEYGADPQGRIDDPVAWVRENAVGLDPRLTLSFLEEFRGSTDVFPNLVLAKDDEGLVIAFVEFGRDEEGRYFPNYAVMCASAGIEEFR
jgi:hypothetical protein